jgi:quercetin dioxygenase-like cupin family protein
MKFTHAKPSPALGLVLVAMALGMSLTLAQDAPKPPAPNIMVLADEPLGGNDRQHVIIGVTNWPPGGATQRHYHAGDEYAVVIEGAIEIDSDGEPPHIYQAGQAYHNKRGVVHVARNANNGPSKLSFVLVTDKGSSMQVPANDARPK